MILDEAQKIKNPATRTSVAARAMNCDFGLALTGTPVENSWTDLWTIMDFVEPGKLESLKDSTVIISISCRMWKQGGTVERTG